MRISCNAFARLQDDQGRYALLINNGRWKYDRQRTLSPIGGGLEATPRGLHTLARLGAAEFESGADLRFQMPDDRLDDVIRWFEPRNARERECSVLRELSEELTDESGTLTRQALRGAREQFAGFAQVIRETSRKHVSCRQTLYLIEIYNVQLSSAAMQTLARAAAYGSLLYFATGQQIIQRATADGTLISSLASTMLSPSKRL